jgi:hypothetical protein
MIEEIKQFIKDKKHNAFPGDYYLNAVHSGYQICLNDIGEFIAILEQHK